MAVLFQEILACSESLGSAGQGHKKTVFILELFSQGCTLPWRQDGEVCVGECLHVLPRRTKIHWRQSLLPRSPWENHLVACVAEHGFAVVENWIATPCFPGGRGDMNAQSSSWCVQEQGHGFLLAGHCTQLSIQLPREDHPKCLWQQVAGQPLAALPLAALMSDPSIPAGWPLG